MKLIGFKRALVFFSLLAVNLAVGGAYIFWLEPLATQTERERRVLDGEIAELGTKIDNVKREVEAFNNNLPAFKELQSRGFMLPQDRLQLGRDFTEIKEKSAISGFTYTVDDIAIITHPSAEEGGLKVINSDIKMAGISPRLDADFYAFMDLIQSRFPAHIRIQSVTIRKSVDVNGDILARIERKEDAGLMSIEAELDWMTIVPKEDNLVSEPEEAALQ